MRKEIWHPADYEDADIRAIQSWADYAAGVAEAPSPEQAKRALDWVINKASQTYENGFVASDQNGRVNAFIDGRRSVGQQIIKMLKLKPEKFKNE